MDNPEPKFPYYTVAERDRISDDGRVAMNWVVDAIRRSLERLVRRIQCTTGFHAWIYNTPEGWDSRVCRRCQMREEYMLVDFGRSKDWVPRSPNSEMSDRPGRNTDSATGRK